MLKKLSICIALISICLLPSKAAFLPIGPGQLFKKEIKAAANHFPEVLGTNLEGESVLLPTEFKGKLNLVLIAFERKQQADVDTWIEGTKLLSEKHPGLEIYELPTIKQMNVFMRFNINNGMRYGIADKERRIRTITLYIDKDRFKESLSINSEAQIKALLIDSSGKILWRATGIASEDKLKSLELLLND